MRVQVDDLSCVPLLRYRSAHVLAVDTALVEARAQELGASSWDVRMALAIELRAKSINIGEVHFIKVQCRGERLDCFYVNHVPGGQYTQATITSALEALGLTAVQCGKLVDRRTKAQLKRGMDLLHPWVRPEPAAAAGEMEVDAGDSDNGSESGDDSDSGNDSSDGDDNGSESGDDSDNGNDSDAGAATATYAGAGGDLDADHGDSGSDGGAAVDMGADMDMGENDAAGGQSEQWTAADFKSLATVLGIESYSADAVLDAISAMKGTAAAASEHFVAAAAAAALREERDVTTGTAAAAAAAALREERDATTGTAAAAAAQQEVAGATTAAACSREATAAALQDQVATANANELREGVTAAAQPTDELGSAVFTALLGLEKTLGGTSLHDEVGLPLQ
jgi:hypothetical protein